LTPGVNFIKILFATFAPIFLCQKITKPKHITREKLRKALLYKKFECKMLMKLNCDGQKCKSSTKRCCGYKKVHDREGKTFLKRTKCKSKANYRKA
jgi:hypothetical protein